MKLYLLLFIFSSLFVAEQSQSASVLLTGKDYYDAIKESCVLVTEDTLKTSQADKIRAGYFPGAKLSEIHSKIRKYSAQDVIDNYNIDKELFFTQSIVREPLVFKALRECYPNSSKMQNVYIQGFKNSDRAGKMAMTAIIFFSYRMASVAWTRSLSVKVWSESAFHFLSKLDSFLFYFTLSSLLNSDTKDSSADSEPQQEVNALKLLMEQSKK